MWTKMQLIDAYILQTGHLDKKMAIPHLNATHVQWFARDMAAVAKHNYSAAVLESCGNDWIDVQNRLIAYYAILGDVTAQLAFFDSRGTNVSAADTVAYLNQNTRCAVKAIVQFNQQIVSGISPAQCWSSVQNDIKAWYAAGHCS